MAIHIERLCNTEEWSVFRDDGQGVDEYLHSDGTWHYTTTVDGKSFPGLFPSEELARKTTLLQVLREGYTICYAPLSRGLILLKKDGSRAEAKVQPTMQEFLSLRSQGLIKHVDTMNQGHHIFHGRVYFYKSTD